MFDDVVMLSRVQFALTSAFHYIYPPLSIGLGVILVIMEGMYLKTGNILYHNMTRFWVTVFGLIFGLGVATGIVLEFEFGTNWATYSRYVGDIFGSALAAEGLFAFFMESGFLAILLFGWNKVSKGLHFFSTVMVALGAMFSAVWIVVANSWQQTPAGYHIVTTNGFTRAEITDFWAMVFNPSAMERLSHVLGGAWLAGAFLVISVSAFYLLKKKHIDFARSSMKIGLVVALVASFFQAGTGHWSAIGVAKNQPAKLAAFEGHYSTSSEPAPLYLFGWVDEKNQKVEGLAIPNMLSLLVHFDPIDPSTWLNAHEKPVIGLNAFKPEDRPPVNFPFQTYHLMVAIGVGLMGLTLLAMFMWWNGTLFTTPWMLRLLVLSVLGPQIANQAGWISAEVGRQPWVVYGLLRTTDGVSKALEANVVLGSLIMFTMIYSLLFVLFLYLLNKKIQKGPQSFAEPSDNPPLPIAQKPRLADA